MEASEAKFNWPAMLLEVRVLLYEEYFEPVSQAMLSLTCREYYNQYGYNHHLFSNSQRGLPNDQILFSATEIEAWDLIIFLINEMSFPYEDDDNFYSIISKSNRIDLVEFFNIDIKAFGEELGEKGTEEMIDYAISKKTDLSALLCDVALHQRRELLEKLIEKFQKRLSILNKLAIYTCALDLEKMKSLVRKPDRLSGKELDVIIYGLGGVNEYSEELKNVMEWFLQFNPSLDQLIDPPEVEDEDEIPEDADPMSTDGILYNLVAAGNPELLVKVLEKVSNDGRFMDHLAVMCAKIAQNRDLNLLRAVFHRFQGIDGRIFMQSFMVMLQDEWDNKTDITFLAMRFPKKTLQEESEKFAVQLQCLDCAFDYFKIKTFDDLDLQTVDTLADFCSWSDVNMFKWLLGRGFTVEMVQPNFVGHLQMNIFGNSLAKYIFEESVKKTPESRNTFDWLFYLTLLRSDFDLLQYLAKELDFPAFQRKCPNFVFEFIRHSRAAKENSEGEVVDGGLVTKDYLFKVIDEDGNEKMQPFTLDGELLDDDYNPSRCIEYLRFCLENGGNWNQLCDGELENFCGYYLDELKKLKEEFGSKKQ